MEEDGRERGWEGFGLVLIIRSFRLDHGIRICDRLHRQKTLSRKKKKGVWRALASAGSY